MNGKVLILIALFASFVHARTEAQIKLPRLVRDSMILQRDAKYQDMGMGIEGRKISISSIRKVIRPKPMQNGNWQVMLSPAKAGGPYTMDVDGKR
jgi:sialate O-acetylesterase